MISQESEEHDHEDVILDMMNAFQEPFHGIDFSIPDGSYYEFDDGVSWGLIPSMCMTGTAAVKAKSNSKSAGVKSRTLPTEQRSQIEKSRIFASLPFQPTDINCLALEELLADKKSAPATSVTRRAMFTTLRFSRRVLSIKRSFAGSRGSSFGRCAINSIRSVSPQS